MYVKPVERVETLQGKCCRLSRDIIWLGTFWLKNCAEHEVNTGSFDEVIIHKLLKKLLKLQNIVEAEPVVLAIQGLNNCVRPLLDRDRDLYRKVLLQYNYKKLEDCIFYLKNEYLGIQSSSL
jgi:hypothetical protein